MDKKLLGLEQRGQNLKHLISISKYKTQENFAEVVCVDVRTLRRWISNGFNCIDIAEICADALDVSVETILFD